uniref:Uncharacterized protein n=1 Tax=Arundo donax TaxID=35708 RepID=A0A0A9HBB0_ARUDO
MRFVFFVPPTSCLVQILQGDRGHHTLC